MTIEKLILIVDSCGILIALFSLIIALKDQNKNLKITNQIQQDTLMHDMVKEEISNWRYIHEQLFIKQRKTSFNAVTENIFDYYEYLAYLINNNKINRTQAFNLWKLNIFRMYNNFKEEFLGERTELRKLYNRWKKLDLK